MSMLNWLDSPAFVDRFGMVVVVVVFGMIAARVLLPSSFQRNVKNAVYHPREWLGL
jgi:hypothetical protein